MLQHHTIQFLLYLSSGHLQEVRNEIEFKTLSTKSGRGHLQEVAALQEISNIVI